MTGYTVHTGSTISFSEGWDRIFQEAEQAAQSGSLKPARTGKAKAAKKSVAKKASRNQSASGGRGKRK